MPGHPNGALMREALEKFTQGDLDGYSSSFADDVLWHVGGDHPLSGDYKGRDSLLEYFERVRDLTDGTLALDVQEVLADDGHCGVIARVTADRDGKHLDVVVAQAFLIDTDGKFSEYWALANDQESVDRFWSD